jgi:hypothetical protein
MNNYDLGDNSESAVKYLSCLIMIRIHYMPVKTLKAAAVFQEFDIAYIYDN